MNKNKIYNIRIIVASVFIVVLATSLILQIKGPYKKIHDINKHTYKFFLEQHEGQQDYEEQTALEFPTRGYVLNVTKTNSECATGVSFPQNPDKSIKFLAEYSTACNLYFDIKDDSKSTLEKLQELSGQWNVLSGNPDFTKVSPQGGDYSVKTDTSNSTYNNTLYTSNNYTWGSSYTLNTTTGKFTLNDTDTGMYWLNSYTSMIHKYIVSLSGTTGTTEPTTNLDQVYYVESAIYLVYGASVASITYKTVNSEYNPITCNDCGIYKSTDDYGNTYYVRGMYDYSYVKFGDLYYRIVRINGDGSLRIIYDGTIPNAKANVGTSSINNMNYQDNGYIGYMYGNFTAPTNCSASSSSMTCTGGSTSLTNAHSNINSSVIKGSVDSWYQTNIVNKSLDNYVENTGFCNDRSVASGNGYGTSYSNYGFATRHSNHTPSFTCPQESDFFTATGSDIGNKALTYKVGLLSADEAWAAGLIKDYSKTENGRISPGNYLVKNDIYWLGTPNNFTYNTFSGINHIYTINPIGYLQSRSVIANSTTANLFGVVPVINLTPEAVQTMTGNGTIGNPFVVH